MALAKPYTSLIDQIWLLLHQARTQVISQVNQIMVLTYRTIGQYIVEYEQGWADRAKYGYGLLQKLSDDLTSKFGKGFIKRNLELMNETILPYLPKNEYTVSAIQIIMVSLYFALWEWKRMRENSMR